jgi:hypothetical protein
MLWSADILVRQRDENPDFRGLESPARTVDLGELPTMWSADILVRQRHENPCIRKLELFAKHAGFSEGWRTRMSALHTKKAAQFCSQASPSAAGSSPRLDYSIHSGVNLRAEILFFRMRPQPRH